MGELIKRNEVFQKIRNQVEVRQGSHASRLKWLDHMLPVEQRLESILDAGCGEALFTPALTHRAERTRAFDSSPVQIAANCEVYPSINFFVQNPADPIVAGTKSLDAIWCADLLSQIIDPAFMLNEFHRVLKPNGKLLVTVPYHGFKKNLMIVLLKWDEYFSPDQPQIRFFTEKTLTRLVKQAGFREIKIETCQSSKSSQDSKHPSDLLLSAKK